jgi:hypothetical protein
MVRCDLVRCDPGFSFRQKNPPLIVERVKGGKEHFLIGLAIWTWNSGGIDWNCTDSLRLVAAFGPYLTIPHACMTWAINTKLVVTVMLKVIHY